MKSFDIHFCFKNNRPTLVIRTYYTNHNWKRFFQGLNWNDEVKYLFYYKYHKEIKKIFVKTF